MYILYTVEELLLVTLSVLINVALITLLERKALSISQFRVGPNKVGALGALQPGADAVKLFTNSSTVLGPMNGALFFLSPVMAMVLMLIFLSLISFNQDHLSSRYTIFIFLMILSLNVYPLLGSGWASNSKYAFIGGLRAAAQTISYEISLAFVLLSMALMWKSMSLMSFLVKGQMVGYLLPAILISGVWLITVVAELNRTPFDFAEGESELVSGFNIEYGSEKFAMIFLAEYGMIYIFSFLSAIMLVNATPAPHSLTAFVGIVISFFIIWLRATLPRFRYDLLMLLTWKSILPVSLGACQLIILIYSAL